MPQRPGRYQPFKKRPSPSQANRPTAAQRGYGYKWQQAAQRHLNDHPLCVVCQAKGIIYAGDDDDNPMCVDHIVPHRGDQILFWDESNWQSLCKRCHDSKTAKGA